MNYSFRLNGSSFGRKALYAPTKNVFTYYNIINSDNTEVYSKCGIDTATRPILLFIAGLRLFKVAIPAPGQLTINSQG